MVKIVVAGAINWDINLFVKRFPEVGEEVAVERITRVPGGKAANVAVAIARILGSNGVALISCLGRDSIAKNHIAILKGEGVNVSGIRFVEETESGQAYIIIDEKGRNVINTLFGANLRLLPEDLLDPERAHLIRESAIVTIIDPPLKTIESMASTAKKGGKTVVWDPGVRSTLGLSRLKEVLRNVDYLVINRVEIKKMTGERDPFEARKRLAKVNPEIRLVAKLGEDGCSMVGPHGVVEVPGINLEGFGMHVVNTVGCGDAFLGVFVASKAEGLNDEEALKRANLAGALKATRPETRGSPTTQELKKYLNLWKPLIRLISVSN
jgi:ribokinase